MLLPRLVELSVQISLVDTAAVVDFLPNCIYLLHGRSTIYGLQVAVGSPLLLALPSIGFPLCGDKVIDLGTLVLCRVLFVGEADSIPRLQVIELGYGSSDFLSSSPWVRSTTGG